MIDHVYPGSEGGGKSPDEYQEIFSSNFKLRLIGMSFIRLGREADRSYDHTTPVTESTPDRSYALSSTWLCDQWSVYLDGITALQHVAYQQWRSLLGQGGLVGGHEAHTQAFPPPLVDHIRSCELPTASFKFPEALHRGGGSSQER